MNNDNIYLPKKDNFEKMPGYVPEMYGMTKVWDRNEHLGLVTGVRAIYKSKIFGICVDCKKPTNRVIDFLGGLLFNCNHF